MQLCMAAAMRSQPCRLAACLVAAAADGLIAELLTLMMAG
jgi:hypothetical protein